MDPVLPDVVAVVPPALLQLCGELGALVSPRGLEVLG